jgi:germination protein YpeB
LCAKLLKDSSCAKNSLAELPLSDAKLTNMNKFISQVGDYASYLSFKVSKGNKLTPGEIKNLISLSQFAKELNTQLQDTRNLITSYNEEYDDPLWAYERLAENSSKIQPVNITDGFKEMEEGFTNFPSLIYDGPFSDHIMNKKSEFLADKEEISKETAQSKAASFIGASQEAVIYTGESNGNLETYSFSYGDFILTVTKKGGYIESMMRSREIEPDKISEEDALNKGREFLIKNGFKDMKESYYAIQGGVCTINYAYTQNGIVCYPDLMKIAVAMDNGDIITFSSNGYLMNHKERDIPEQIISIDKAQTFVSNLLTIEAKQSAFIPTSGLNEAFCYEFKCVSEDGERVIVYINAQSGMEENILIILDSDDGGTLVM